MKRILFCIIVLLGIPTISMARGGNGAAVGLGFLGGALLGAGAVAASRSCPCDPNDPGCNCYGFYNGPVVYGPAPVYSYGPYPYAYGYGPAYRPYYRW